MLNNSTSGFSLIEVLVVVAVTALLSSIMVIYSSSSRQQIALYTEESKIVQEILRAKSFSVTTYRSSLNPTCGYGVHIDYARKTYSLFSYVPNPSQGITCGNIVSLVPAGAENNIETFSLNNNLIFGSAANRLDYAFFLPPNPDTLLAVNGNPSAKKDISGSVPLSTSDGSASVIITVSPAGQVTF